MTNICIFLRCFYFTEFEATEKEMLIRRFENAANMEKEYQNRILRVKEKNDPAVRAIRATKSFAKPNESKP